MDKLPCETPNQTDQNIEKIAALFPNVITEIKDEEHSTPEKTVYKKGINFELLKQELSGDVADGDECYDFTWVGKKACIVEGNKPVKKTLRPCMEESKDWEHTGNLYIEGDNLDVLKLLQESYLNSVKMIYIDPPYNTGNDFIYKDDFAMDKDDYDEQISLYDDDGNRLFQNTESNGRFHSDWCSMMYPRLKLAQNLLTDDGVIFISIDDNEVHNLRKMCDEVFGESNYIGTISRLMKTGGNKGQFFSPNIDFILVYSKIKNVTAPFKGEFNPKLIDKLYNRIEVDGPNQGKKYRPFGLYQSSLDARPNQRYYIQCPDGTFVIPPGTSMPKKIYDGSKVTPNSTDGCWRWSSERYLTEKQNNNIEFIKSPSGVLIKPDGTKSEWNVYTKIWLSDRQEQGQTPTNFISKFESRHSARELKGLDIPFDFAKPSGLIKYLISLIGDTSNSVILDFFSGSATTAHAVMQLNAEDGGNRKFIMVQLPEPCDEKSEAYKAGYKNICEIGKERIRRAGEKIKVTVEEENAQLKLGEEPKRVPDIGFRVLKQDETNMKDVYYSAEEYSQTTLENMESNIKEGRTDLDLLYGVLLDWGLKLTDNHKIVELNGVRVHCYNFDADTCQNNGLPQDCALMACFADNVGEDVIRAIAKSKPQRAVFRDSSFTDSPEKINVTEIFKLLAPDTSVKVI
jgi:adenine-specific DNA-methyltransferase